MLRLMVGLMAVVITGAVMSRPAQAQDSPTYTDVRIRIIATLA